MEYPIHRYNNTDMNRFGIIMYFVLMDAHSGYHQVKLTERSVQWTASFALGA